MPMELMTVLNRALDEAGAVLMRHYGALETVEKKGLNDLVTVADRESEAVVKTVVRSAFPDHTILGEETGEDIAGCGPATRWRWIVDPVDGTTNYAHGMPFFCVSIGVEHHGEMVAAGVFNPYYGERYLAEKGSGATLNSRRIAVSKTPNLAEGLVVTGFPYTFRNNQEHFIDQLRRFVPRVQGVLRMGSAALDLCSVACGRLEAYWQEGLSPWDTAAGYLIVEEAGGRVTGFDGGKFSPFGHDLLATNGSVHNECVEALRGIVPLPKS